MTVSKWGWTAYGVALLAIAVDQASKQWILTSIPPGSSIPVIWPLNLTLSWNEGFSFGLMSGHGELARWGLFVFALAVAGLLAVWARKSTNWLAGVGLGFVLAGALGNAIDRARYGAVVDFIDVSRLGFFPWIFNVADSCITIGVVLLLIESMRPQQPA
jgi:signal peptidase II